MPPEPAPADRHRPRRREGAPDATPEEAKAFSKPSPARMMAKLTSPFSLLRDLTTDSHRSSFAP
jgi:hypothetical protein